MNFLVHELHLKEAVKQKGQSLGYKTVSERAKKQGKGRKERRGLGTGLNNKVQARIGVGRLILEIL